MSSLNEGLRLLPTGYLFSEVRSRVRRRVQEGADVIDLTVGDIAYPLPEYVVGAMSSAVLEMCDNVRFRGYPPDFGYYFLRQAIAKRYAPLGASISEDDVYVGCGGKSDAYALLDLFGEVNAYVVDPSYPVYADASTIKGLNVIRVEAGEENGFLPPPPPIDAPSVIWLCSPSNPTGEAYGSAQLKEWVDVARGSGSVILFDAAYSAFAEGDSAGTIYCVEGAEECAVELNSFSKSAGFTGVRCSWVVMPASLRFGGERLSPCYRRLLTTSFNGVPYFVQRGAEAALSTQGAEEYLRVIRIYKDNARRLKYFFEGRGVRCFGGISAPYVWVKCPLGLSSSATVEMLLDEVGVACTPGAGFGRCGEGYFRISGFCTEQAAREAIDRLGRIF